MFPASSCPSSGAMTTAVAASGLPSGLGDSSAVGHGWASRPDHGPTALPPHSYGKADAAAAAAVVVASDDGHENAPNMLSCI